MTVASTVEPSSLTPGDRPGSAEEPVRSDRQDSVRSRRLRGAGRSDLLGACSRGAPASSSPGRRETRRTQLAAEIAACRLSRRLDASSMPDRSTDIRRRDPVGRRRLGRIDILVNCVGIQREQALLEVTEETFDLVYETNLKSAMFLRRPWRGIRSSSRSPGGISTFCPFARSSRSPDAATRPIAAARAACSCWSSSMPSSWRRTTSRSTASRRPSSSRIASAHISIAPSSATTSWPAIRSAGSAIRSRWPDPSWRSRLRPAATSPGQVIFVDGGITASQ